jgi:hypothetical protein
MSTEEQDRRRSTTRRLPFLLAIHNGERPLVCSAHTHTHAQMLSFISKNSEQSWCCVVDVHGVRALLCENSEAQLSPLEVRAVKVQLRSYLARVHVHTTGHQRVHDAGAVEICGKVQRGPTPPLPIGHDN